MRYTSRDLERLPDVEGTRYEIIDGDLFVSKTPHAEHQWTSDQILVALANWSSATDGGVALSTPGLIFSPDNDVVPDIIWIRSERLAQALDEAGHFRVAPDLVVEILSPGPVNERRDRELKLNLYSRQGVHEYWIADWRHRTLQVFRREQAALQLAVTLEGEDVLTSPLLPGFQCSASQFWGFPA